MLLDSIHLVRKEGMHQAIYLCIYQLLSDTDTEKEAIAGDGHEFFKDRWKMCWNMVQWNYCKATVSISREELQDDNRWDKCRK